MEFVRFARNCVDAESIVPTRCLCCEGIKLLLLDSQNRVRAIGSLSIDELRSVLANAEAGKLPPFKTEKIGGTQH